MIHILPCRANQYKTMYQLFTSVFNIVLNFLFITIMMYMTGPIHVRVYLYNSYWHGGHGPVEIILPEQEVRKISVSRSVPWLKGSMSVYPDIALHISNYCVYCRIWYTQYKCTENFQGIKKPTILVYRLTLLVAPVNTLFLDRSISASQSVQRNSKGHVESVQPMKCMLFILMCNNE